MPSSSSSEEDLSKFQEAADTTLYNDSLFKGKQASEDKPTIGLPSQRVIEEEDDSFRKELRVTPQFQSHVAKHLTKLLDSQLDINDFDDASDQKGKETSKHTQSKDQSRHILKPKRHNSAGNCKQLDGEANSGGVRLFGASAVFLSNMNITPIINRRRKRGRKFANFSSGSESSSEDSDSDDMQKLSAAAVSSDWVLSGAATKGWTNKEGKLERCVVNKSGILVSVKDDLSRGYESLNEIGSSNNNSKEVLNSRAKDDIACLKLSKSKPSHLENELAASFSSVVSIGSDSQADMSCKRHKCKKKKKLKKKKRRKEQHSEDATTETTEVEDVVEERKKAKKERRKMMKRLRAEEKKSEESLLIEDCACKPDEDEKRKKKRRKKKSRSKDLKEPVESFLKTKRSKSSRIIKRDSKKKITRKVLRLSDDLAKLMMTPNENS